MKGENAYFISPEDERELARLIIQDNLFNDIIDPFPPGFPPKNHQNMRVLDLGCGPGGWPLQIAQKFPELSVTGVDISTNMILYARAQAEARGLSTQFRIMDILKLPWEIPDNSFDFINMRFTSGYISSKYIKPLVRECKRILRHRGIIRNVEFTHFDAPLSPSNRKLYVYMLEAMYKANRTDSPYEMSNNTIIEKIYKEEGFTNITKTPYLADLSIGAPMHLVMLQNQNMAVSLLIPFLTSLGIASTEEIERLCLQQTKEWTSPNFCAHWYMCAISGEKSEEKHDTE